MHSFKRKAGVNSTGQSTNTSSDSDIKSVQRVLPYRLAEGEPDYCPGWFPASAIPDLLTMTVMAVSVTAEDCGLSEADAFAALNQALRSASEGLQGDTSDILVLIGSGDGFAGCGVCRMPAITDCNSASIRVIAVLPNGEVYEKDVTPSADHVASRIALITARGLAT